MSKNSHNKGSGLAVGAAIGAVAGVITGILFAPKSGKETRDELKGAALKARTRIVEESEHAQVELGKAIEKAEAVLIEKGGTVSTAAKQVIADAKDAKSSLTAKIKQVSTGVEFAEAEMKTALKKVEDAQKAIAKILQ